MSNWSVRFNSVPASSSPLLGTIILIIYLSLFLSLFLSPSIHTRSKFKQRIRTGKHIRDLKLKTGRTSERRTRRESVVRGLRDRVADGRTDLSNVRVRAYAPRPTRRVGRELSNGRRRDPISRPTPVSESPPRQQRQRSLTAVGMFPRKSSRSYPPPRDI